MSNSLGVNEMWNKILAFAGLFDSLMTLFLTIAAFVYFYHGAIDKAIFAILAASFFGRGQVKRGE